MPVMPLSSSRKSHMSDNRDCWAGANRHAHLGSSVCCQMLGSDGCARPHVVREDIRVLRDTAVSDGPCAWSLVRGGSVVKHKVVLQHTRMCK